MQHCMCSNAWYSHLELPMRCRFFLNLWFLKYFCSTKLSPRSLVLRGIMSRINGQLMELLPGDPGTETWWGGHPGGNSFPLPQLHEDQVPHHWECQVGQQWWELCHLNDAWSPDQQLQHISHPIARNRNHLTTMIQRDYTEAYFKHPAGSASKRERLAVMNEPE